MAIQKFGDTLQPTAGKEGGPKTCYIRYKWNPAVSRSNGTENVILDRIAENDVRALFRKDATEPLHKSKLAADAEPPRVHLQRLEMAASRFQRGNAVVGRGDDRHPIPFL